MHVVGLWLAFGKLVVGGLVGERVKKQGREEAREKENGAYPMLDMEITHCVLIFVF